MATDERQIPAEVQALADEFYGGNILSVYTREDAIADGSIVDVSELAREYGFRVPVAFSREVWALVDVTGKRTIEDTTGRTWDVLTMLRHAAKRTEGDRLTFRVKIGGRNVELKSKIDGDGILVSLDN